MSNSQEFDPHQVLLEHKQFFEANRNTFSPLPKRFISPNESAERSFKAGSVDYKEMERVRSLGPNASGGNEYEGHEGYQKPEQETQDKNKELLIMTIEIGDGNRDTLSVFEDDDPYELARKFCEDHGLSEQIIEPLAQNIYSNIEKVLEERAQGVTEEVTNQEYQEPNNVGNYQQTPLTEPEIFKDSGIKTGEFKVFHEQPYQSYHQQQQKMFQDNQIDSRRFQSLNKESQGTEPSEQHHKSIGYPYNQEEVFQRGWEGQGASSRQSNLEFGIKPSMEGQSRTRTQDFQYTEHSTQNDEMQRKLTKSTEASQRLSFIEYPSDTRFNNGNSFPENFQNEEEYLEYLIASQYGGGRRNSFRGGKNNELTFTPQINKSSRTMLENKYQNSKVNVYDRLHNHAKLRNQKLSNSNLKSPRKSVGATGRKSTNSNYDEINYGCLLYHRGIKRKEEVFKARMDAKKEKLIQEESECTFKPYVNPISEEIVNSKPKPDRTEDSLIHYGRAVKEKAERARSVQKEREVESCTFKPSINPTSVRIVHEKESRTHDPIKDRFTKLFCDSKIRQAQQEIRQSIYQEHCTFTPAINDYSGSLIDQTNFDQRNQRFTAKLNKMENLRRQREELELFDPNTGQPLFRPLVGRPPREGSRERERQMMNIGEHLYNRRFEKENLQRDLIEREQRSMEAKQVRSSEKSHMIMENIQKKRLREIFACFDSDEDGYISSNKIDISTVGTDILEAFAPLLCEMEELNHTLSLQEFIEAAERLLKTLPVHERDKLLLQKKNPNKNSFCEDLKFHPEINRKSAKIAQYVRPYGDFEAVYEQYVGEKRAHEQKIKIEQERKKEEEMKECSFKPTLISETNIPLFAMNNFNYYYVDKLA